MINLGAPEHIRSILHHLVFRHEPLCLYGVRLRQMESDSIGSAYTGNDLGAAGRLGWLASWINRDETLPPQNREMDFQTKVRSGAVPLFGGALGLVAFPLSACPFQQRTNTSSPCEWWLLVLALCQHVYEHINESDCPSAIASERRRILDHPASQRS